MIILIRLCPSQISARLEVDSTQEPGATLSYQQDVGSNASRQVEDDQPDQNYFRPAKILILVYTQ